MNLQKIAALGACLVILVVGAFSQNLKPLLPVPIDTLTDRANTPTMSDAMQKELRQAGDYMTGRGVPKDPEAAARLYRQAADQGDPAAQNQLGFLYLTGVGVQPDDVQAFKWFARAAGSGFEPAKLNLAVMYMHGQGVARDPSLGLQMLQDLAARGDANAQDYLGVAYYTGMGVKIDHSQGEKWFARAARHHDPEGEFDMGLIESSVADHAHDFARAAAYFRSAAEAGYVPAMHSLGLLLMRRPELARKPDEAGTMLLKAAQAGFWRSSVLLGVMARDGKGRAVDEAEAFRWFLIAAGQGGSVAQNLLVNDLAVGRAALDPAIQTQEQQQADAWVQQHRTRFTFLIAERRRNQAFPLAEIREPLSLTLN